MQTVAKPIMINFIQWLSADHPNIRNLQELPNDSLLQLVSEIETQHNLASLPPEMWLRSLPVIVRSCLFKYTALAPLEPVNDPDAPLSTIEPAQKRDGIWMNVAQQVRDLLATQD